MNKFMYLLIISVFLLEWDLEFIPRVVRLIPEIFMLIASAIVIVQFASRKPFMIQGKYILYFIFLLLLIIVGIVANQVEPGIIFSGVRKYMMFLPMFLLPAVYRFSDEQITKQLKLILFLLLLQTPLVIYQRFFVDNFIHADYLSGSVGNVKVLSGVLLWSVAVIFSFYLHRRMNIKFVLIICSIFLIPLVLTETAGSIFLLPLAIILPMIYADLGQNKLKYLLNTILFGGLFLITLVLGYDHFYGKRWGEGGIIAFIKEGRVVEFESSENKRIFDKAGIGRLAAIKRSIEILWKMDRVKLMVGVGIGNASDAFTNKLRGKYYNKHLKDGISKHTISNFIWTFGLLGIVFFYIFWFMVLKDSIFLARGDYLVSAISLGWIGVLGIFAGQSIYINVTQPNVMGCLFAYFSGYIAAQRLWLNRAINS